MDEIEFKQLAIRLEKAAEVLEKLPPEVRHDAFCLMEDYVRGSAGAEMPKWQGDAGESPAQGREEFFGAFSHDKPADNVKLIAADFYRQYGTESFSVKEALQAANEVGITVPSRIDKTLNAAKDKGKSLFTRAGRGMFKPTVHGEAYLKATYSIKKGTKKRQREEG